MKIRTVHVGYWIRKIKRSAFLLKIFGMLMVATLCLLLIVGIFSATQNKFHRSPMQSMKSLAAAVSSDFFIDIMGLEIPNFSGEKRNFTFSDKNVFQFLFHFITDTNPNDPKTILAKEVPGLGKDHPILLRKGGGTDVSVGPADYGPREEQVKKENGSNNQKDITPETEEQNHEQQEEPGSSLESNKKTVFIYHSHNRESWLPELKHRNLTKLSDAFDSETNITLLGKRLAEQLEERGIGTMRSDADYPSIEKDFNYYLAYSYSAKTVKEAIATNPEIDYIFDIHRDALERKRTTVSIDGVEYAQLYFIIGQKNPDWQKNEAFAQKIQDKLEEKYPGISRGIWGKTAETGNGEYNQSFSPNSLLVEIGGPENTLEESYRTIDALAEVVSEIYWDDAEKVDAPITATK